MRTRILIVAVISLSLTGCAISEQDEIKMGRQSHAKFEQQFGGLYPDQRVQSYVQQVGEHMAQQAGRPNLDWQYKVVNSKDINAFAVPGGYVYLTRGLLYKLDNEAQLAGVLGHESGHVAERHSVKQIERARGLQVGTTVVGVVGGLFGYGSVGNVASLVANLAQLSYSRDQERQADMDGLKYMTRAGYNPVGMVQTMQILKQAGGSGGGPQFLKTHPDPGNRIQYLTDAIKKDYGSAAQTGAFNADQFHMIVLGNRPPAGPAPSAVKP